MIVAVGSQNPVKIEAVKMAFEKLFPNQTWDVRGVDVDSGVSNQPMSDEESIKGSRNRALLAMERLGADYGVGLEGDFRKSEIIISFAVGWSSEINKGVRVSAQRSKS